MAVILVECKLFEQILIYNFSALAVSTARQCRVERKQCKDKLAYMQLCTALQLLKEGGSWRIHDKVSRRWSAEKWVFNFNSLGPSLRSLSAALAQLLSSCWFPLTHTAEPEKLPLLSLTSAAIPFPS